jgi:hypothetical protein
MMKRIRLIIALSLIVCTACADQFQLKTTSDSFDVSYVRVEIIRDGRSIFSGATDKIGRITITGLANDIYPAHLRDSLKREKVVNFEINGGEQLRIVTVE